MFEKAKIKLTSWYLLIIMLVSIVFSLVIYVGVNKDLERFERMQGMRLKADKSLVLPPPLSREFNEQFAADARNRLIFTLIFINSGIFVLAGFAGYLLAGITLRPIKEMVDEQNRFIADASHELRTPLTSLKTSIEVGLRNKKMTLQEAKKLIESNLEDVQSLQVLSDGLIRLNYYQKPNGSKAFEQVSIKNILANALTKVKPMALKNKIKIISKAADNKIQGDEKSLTELFAILLDNAIKYGKTNSQVEVSVKKLNNRMVVVVSDKGIGIDEKDLPHVFERFYRAEKSRSKKDVAGYGLGLSIAKKIVEMHNGIIKIKSKKDEGTTFTVTL